MQLSSLTSTSTLWNTAHLELKETAMNRLAGLALACAVAGIASGLMLAKAQQSRGAVLIAGDHPVASEQIAAKLKSDGWSDIVMSLNGKYFQVTGVINGQPGNIAVDSLTGRLRADDDDDDD
jgi:hypothetical protein